MLVDCLPIRVRNWSTQKGRYRLMKANMKMKAKSVPKMETGSMAWMMKRATMRSRRDSCFNINIGGGNC